MSADEPVLSIHFQLTACLPKSASEPLTLFAIENCCL